jgi:hypothetical protein
VHACVCVCVREREIEDPCWSFDHLEQWFPTCGTHTRRTGWWYAKIILVVAESTQKNFS